MYGGVLSSNMFNFSHFFYKSTNIPDYLLFKCQKFFVYLGTFFFWIALGLGIITVAGLKEGRGLVLSYAIVS